MLRECLAVVVGRASAPTLFARIAAIARLSFSYL
ncbi:DUF6053 domain-containing protein [Lysobacter capsici]